MSVRPPRSLPHVLFLFLGIAGACSLQVPDEKDVFSDAPSTGGKNSGGSSGKAGASSTTLGGAASGGSTATDAGGAGGNTGASGASTTLGGAGSAGASSGGTSTAGTAGKAGGTSIGGTSNAGAGGITLTAGAGGANATGGTGAVAGSDGLGGSAGAGAVGGSDTAGTAGIAGYGGNAGSSGAGTGGLQGTGGAPDPLSIGLVAHYKFDEPVGSGTVAINSIDATKSGTYMGAATRTNTGKFSRAARIRNENITTEYVELAPGLLTGLSASTISVWVRDLTNARRGARAFDFGSGTGNNFFLVPHATDPTTAVDGAEIAGASSGLTYVNIWGDGNFANSVWHLFTATWSANAIEFYVDGVLAATKTTPSVLPSDISASPNFLGKTYNDTAAAMYAEFDDLRIYNYVLTPALIKGLYEML